MHFKLKTSSLNRSFFIHSELCKQEVRYRLKMEDTQIVEDACSAAVCSQGEEEKQEENMDTKILVRSQ